MRESELRRLLQEMSLEEKVNQLLQIAGTYYQDESVLTGPAVEASGITGRAVEQAGSVLTIMGAETLMNIQKKHLEKQPHKIPLIFMLDVINGYRTIYPIPLAQGASFDPELVRRCARMAATEAAVGGVHVNFSPFVNLARDARWGRCMETMGEDPYLNSRLAEAMIIGYQGEEAGETYEPYHMPACIKCFAGYGAATAGRDYNTVELSEHTFREFYLPPYRAGIEAGVEMFMTSFNIVNDIPATGNQWLMRDVLREELGFDGVLISDWQAIEEMIAHGYCEDRKEAALRAIEAGVDIDMMTSCYSANLKDLVEEGRISEELVDESVWRVLKLKNKLGLFENPFKDADPGKEKEILLCPEHRSLARAMARESFVLLKNEGNMLPVKDGKDTAFIGPYVKEQNLTGSWSFYAYPEDGQRIEEAAVIRYGEDVILHRGCDILDESVKLEGFGKDTPENTEDIVQMGWIEEAVEIARNVKKVILFLGEHRLQSGEAASRAEILLPSIQMELFRRVCQVNKNVAVVIFTGRPLDLREIRSKTKAILIAWMPGTEGAGALMDVLSGDYAPQGKLPMCFPYCVGQVPVYYNNFTTGRPYKDGEEGDHFHSRYLDIPNAPLYPFGYGLSYTEFSVSGPHLDREVMRRTESIKASVEVRNTGDVTGTETLQLYIRDLAASTVRPEKELKGFQKVTLAPGESRVVEFMVTEKELQFVAADGVLKSEPGKFHVMIGTDSNVQETAEFTLI